MNGFVLRELFLVDKDVEMGASMLSGGKIRISKDKIMPCLNC